ncbi:hypothetical protein C0993_002260 [Termitomyces sp. T159_Od127]|nr:hypothetical protein C0993_002260 [Termitomyces sp. T159_Od127]
MLTLRRESPHTGCMVLDLKLIGTKLEFHSRNICVLPDKMIGQNLDAVYLVWPSDYKSEVSVVVALPGLPEVIETGIKSEDMMKEDMWIQISGNEPAGAADDEHDLDDDDNSDNKDGLDEGDPWGKDSPDIPP